MRLVSEACDEVNEHLANIVEIFVDTEYGSAFRERLDALLAGLPPGEYERWAEHVHGAAATWVSRAVDMALFWATAMHRVCPRCHRGMTCEQAEDHIRSLEEALKAAVLARE